MASVSAWDTGAFMRSTIGFTNSSSLARVIFICKCFGPDWSAVMNGKFTSVSKVVESSILAFSAASLTLFIAMRSAVTSIPDSDLKLPDMKSIKALSMSFPPRAVSPLVDKTSKVAWLSTSEKSIMVTSKVPPPKSNTKIFWSLAEDLSSP